MPRQARLDAPGTLHHGVQGGTFVQRQLVVNRAPVSSLWASVVSEVLGFEHDKGLTLGRAVMGLNAYLKGVSLWLFQPIPTPELLSHP